MKAIVVVDRNWGIGKDNSLLAHLPGDLKYFREKTKGKVIVIGRQTLESFPGGKPLPERTNIVLTTNEDYPAACEVCCSKEHLFQCLEGYDPEDVFIAGGEQIYREFLPYCDTVYVTKIDAVFPADRYFADLDKDREWEPVFQSDPVTEKGLSYRFTEYKRVP
ncbi:MAG TPA: dihydrofolate reductase [Bacillota bacterium]|jgi:dihydrofolate reductase|nr:dihydrofolate reductase [Bacillota bacterium]